ncbi:MAG: response regulator [Acidobacteria bacterium]|nr:response regulator [Acidobacteriota bacterium]
MSLPTVFIIEDDVDTRDMLAKFLELEGYKVEMAANGRQALDRFLGGASACVIVLDLMMPVMDGWEFRRRQVEDARLRAIPTIVVSAAGRDRLSQISADAYLSKPVDMDELLQRVSQFCSV